MDIQDYMAITLVAVIVVSAAVKVIISLVKPPKDDCGCGGKKCKNKFRV